MTLQEKLKAATTSEHDQLETQMFVGQIMSKMLSIEQYNKILMTNYLIHASYEELLFSTIPKDMGKALDLDERKKLTALEKDLLQAELAPAVVVTPNNRNWTLWSALGALYVLEGATLGGKVIYKQLLANPNFANSSLDLNYYNIYGDQLMAKWSQFVGILNSVTEEHHQEVIDGAKAMFNEISQKAQEAVAAI